MPKVTHQTLPAAVVWMALAALLLGAAGLFLWLAQRDAAPPPVITAPAPSPPSQKAVVSAPDADAVLAQREQARTLATTLVDKRRQLAARGVERWGARRYAELRTLAQRGNKRFAARDFAGAAKTYRSAIAVAGSLLARTDTVLAGALERGHQALARGDAMAAVTAFGLALAVDADNADAREGAERAADLDKVLALLKEGRAREHDGELAAARDIYRQALRLDGQSAAARAALKRVEATLTERRFAQRMSEGLAALERGDYASARSAFRAADTIRPDTAAVVDGLAQSMAGLKRQAIVEGRARAETLAADERWQAALAEYEKLLAIDHTVTFARAGRERAARRALLAMRLAYHIGHSQRLGSSNVQTSAQALLAEAETIKHPGPRLHRQVEVLADRLAKARTPVPVRLRSDNRTQVLLYHVGVLGAFESEQISLPPGEYTAVGRRSGYRDVRREFTVAAGRPVGPILIRCEERI